MRRSRSTASWLEECLVFLHQSELQALEDKMPPTRHKEKHSYRLLMNRTSRQEMAIHCTLIGDAARDQGPGCRLLERISGRQYDMSNEEHTVTEHDLGTLVAHQAAILLGSPIFRPPTFTFFGQAKRRPRSQAP